MAVEDYTVIISKIEYEHATVTLYADSRSKAFGILVPGSASFRMHAPKRMKEDVKLWRLIQKERKRIGLPPLTAEEMIV